MFNNQTITFYKCLWQGEIGHLEHIDTEEIVLKKEIYILGP